jgi:hypothetical protein
MEAKIKLTGYEKQLGKAFPTHVRTEIIKVENKLNMLNRARERKPEYEEDEFWKLLGRLEELLGSQGFNLSTGHAGGPKGCGSID